jgi:hypothetical protein
MYVKPEAANSLPYSIGVRSPDGVYYNTDLIWITQDQNAAPGTDAYNALYSIQHFVDIFNDAMRYLNGLTGLNGYVLGYDPTTQRFLMQGGVTNANGSRCFTRKCVYTDLKLGR